MITKTHYETLDGLFDYYNKKLFEGKLKDCMIITNRKKGNHGHFYPKNWQNRKSNETEIHEISLNPDSFNRADAEWQSTLVHEMVHQWQHDFGTPTRGNYHNKEWARKMEDIGLMPSNTGKEGGKKTGQRMSHYIIPDGLFMEAFSYIKGRSIKYVSYEIIQTKKGADGEEIKIDKPRSKVKYTCPCGVNVWGKPELNLVCDDCKNHFKQAE